MGKNIFFLFSSAIDTINHSVSIIVSFVLSDNRFHKLFRTVKFFFFLLRHLQISLVIAKIIVIRYNDFNNSFVEKTATVISTLQYSTLKLYEKVVYA